MAGIHSTSSFYCSSLTSKYNSSSYDRSCTSSKGRRSAAKIDYDCLASAMRILDDLSNTKHQARIDYDYLKSALRILNDLETQNYNLQEHSWPAIGQHLSESLIKCGCNGCGKLFSSSKFMRGSKKLFNFTSAWQILILRPTKYRRIHSRSWKGSAFRRLRSITKLSCCSKTYKLLVIFGGLVWNK